MSYNRRSYYGGREMRRDAEFPKGFAPEDNMPDEIRRTERLRHREQMHRLAELLITNGATIEVAAAFLPEPRDVRSQERRWRMRMEDARMAANPHVCSMPVHGCPLHGDTFVWRYGEYKCRVATCRSRCVESQQRRPCPWPRVAVIDYPSGHSRRVCAGHLASERALWAQQAAEHGTITVTDCPIPADLASGEPADECWVSP